MAIYCFSIFMLVSFFAIFWDIRCILEFAAADRDGRDPSYPRNASELRVPDGDKKCDGLYKAWAMNAQNFMTCIGMNANFSCTTVFAISDTNPLRGWGTIYDTRKRGYWATWGDTILEGMPAHHRCKPSSRRLIIKHDPISRRKDIYELDAGRYPDARNATTSFMLHKLETEETIAVRAKRSSSDTCSPSSSCKAYITSVYERKLNDFSFFAEFTEIPGVKIAEEELEKDNDDLENLAADFTAANIAIFFLPLVLSIPPISVMDSASDK